MLTARVVQGKQAREDGSVKAKEPRCLLWLLGWPSTKMKMRTQILTYFFAVVFTSSVIAQQVKTQGDAEKPSYSLEKLCKKSGKVVLWIGSLNDEKDLVLKGLPIEDALKKLSSSHDASYSYDDNRFIFRKLDFLEGFGDSNFGTVKTNKAYQFLVTASDDVLRQMPDDYDKEALGAEQQGVPSSHLSAKERLLAQEIASTVSQSPEVEQTLTESKSTYGVSANMYHSLKWFANNTSFAMNEWRPTNHACSPDRRINWDSTDREVEKFEGTLEQVLLEFGFDNITIDPRFKSSHLLLYYPKKMTKKAVFEQMKNDIPFKSRELAGHIHVFNNSGDVTSYRLLTVGDRLYNQANACSYDAWQQFAYNDSPVKIADLTATQKDFVKNFVDEHNRIFPEDAIPLAVGDESFEEGAFSFAPYINLSVTKTEVVGGKSNVVAYDFQLTPSKR